MAYSVYPQSNANKLTLLGDRGIGFLGDKQMGQVSYVYHVNYLP